MELSVLVEYLRPVGLAILAGFIYTFTGWLNFWITKRKDNPEAEWDWKKMAATATSAVFSGIIIGIAQHLFKYDVAIGFEFLVSIGLNTMLKKFAFILWYGKDLALDAMKEVGVRIGFRK